MAFIIYLAGVVGNIQGLLVALSLVGGIVGGLLLLFGFMEDEDGLKVWAEKIIPSAVAAAIIAALIPSTTTIYMMVAADMAETQIDSPENQEIFGKVRKLVIQKLDEALEQ